jgi:cytochrome P460
MNKIVAIAVLYLISLPAALWAGSTPSLPKSYHSWQKSGRKVVTDKSSPFYGIHYIFADKKAMDGYKAGNKFAEGSSIIIEYFNIKEGSGSPVEGSRNMVVLMRKDKRMKATGGWLFAGYGADGAPSGLDPVTTCFGCHQKDAAQRDYVISTISDFKK